MNATEKQPIWIGFDPAKADSRPSHTFICSSCARQHINQSFHLPDGWEKIYAPNFDLGLHCPDCIEKVEQHVSAKIRERRETLENAIRNVGAIGIHPTPPRTPARPGPFSLHLQRQENGQYLIAMTPETALMRLSPLEFFLSAEGARTLAWQLLRHADLTEAPGTLPASVGEGR
ncbi:MAG: hypothetical protein AB7E05_09200 [Sphingobium sp.]